MLVPKCANSHYRQWTCQYAYWDQYAYLHMPLLVLGFVCTDAPSSEFRSVLATTLHIYLLEVDLVNIPVPVWVQCITGTGIPFNASTGNVPCQYWYILVQY